MDALSVFNIILLLFLGLFPVMIELNKRIFRGKSGTYNKILKTGRKIHPLTGLVLIITGYIHGSMMLGSVFILHTGSLLLILLLFSGITGFLYKMKKTRKIAYIHRIIGVFVIAAFLIHYMRPWLFSSF